MPTRPSRLPRPPGPRGPGRGRARLQGVRGEPDPRADPADRRDLPHAADRDHRAMAGLSRGAMQALQIGLAHTDTFASIGAFSPPPGGGPFDVKTAYNGGFRDPRGVNGKMRLFWLGAGTAEQSFAAGVRTMHERLEAAGVRHVASNRRGRPTSGRRGDGPCTISRRGCFEVSNPIPSFPDPPAGGVWARCRACATPGTGAPGRPRWSR